MLISKCPEFEDFKGSYVQLRKGFGARALLITSIVPSGFPGSAFPSKNLCSFCTDTNCSTGSRTRCTHHAMVTHGSHVCRIKALSTLLTQTHTGVKGLILLILLLPQTILTHSCSKAKQASKAAICGYLHRYLFLKTNSANPCSKTKPSCKGAQAPGQSGFLHKEGFTWVRSLHEVSRCRGEGKSS